MLDYYAELASQQACPSDATLPEGLASGFVDGCTAWSTGGDHQKNEARRCYIECASFAGLRLPSELGLDARPRTMLRNDWLAIQVQFQFLTSWYSKDDRPFHVLDNPVRKDRVFGVPCMSASSWKGMLRWACRMQEGLREYLKKNRGSFDGWREPAWILHLFGNEKDEQKSFGQGALVFYASWFDKIGFEVINPHSRERRAGIQPIFYEVVPASAKGALYLLYAPWPGMKEPQDLDRKQAVEKLLQAIEQLLTIYGISAKRTVGWGTARIEQWKAYRKRSDPVPATSRAELWDEMQRWFGSRGKL